MTTLAGAGSAREQLKSYLASFVGLGRKRLVKVFLLVATGTFVEGVGILLLVPLLGLIFPTLPGSGVGDSMFSGLRAALEPMSANTQLAMLLGLFLVLLCIRAIMTWQRDIQNLRLSQDFVDFWRANIVRAVTGASWRRLQEMQNSRLEFAAANEVARLAAGSDLLLRGIMSAVQLLLLLALALYLSPILTGLAFVCVLAGVPLLLPLVRASHRYGEVLSQDGSKRQNIFSELLSGMKLAKVHGAERRFADEFIAVSDRMRERALNFARAQFRMHNAFQMAGGVAAAAMVYIGIVWLQTAPAILTSLLILMTRIIGPVQQLAQSAQSILTMLPAIGHLNAIQASLGADGTEAEVQATDTQPPRVASEPLDVSLNAISYTPPAHEEPLFRGLDCTIAAGELAVLLGPSGGGKTTIADLMLGLIDPASGSVAVGGHHMADDAERDRARAKIAYVPQDPFLFDRSVRENLLWAEPQASEEQMWKALASAEAADFVHGLPDGLNSAVGNRGSRLSGGERQRICLARALLRNPGLLILDEATSALDPAVEERLLQTLMRLRGEITLLVIAHRLPDWFAADRLFVLEGGQLHKQAAVSKSAAHG